MICTLIFIGTIIQIGLPAVLVLSGNLFIFSAGHFFSFGLIIYAVILINRTYSFQKMHGILLNAAILVLFFPVAGIYAAVAMVLIVGIFSEKARTGLYDEFEEYIEETKPVSRIKESYEDMASRIKSEISFESYADIMRWGDVTSKMRVIGKITLDPRPETISLLREFIKDRSPEVRFYASGALIKIESEIMSNINLAEKNARKRGAAEDFAYVGDLYKRYINLGLVPKDLLSYYLNLACKAFQTSLDINTAQPTVVLDYARCLMKLEKDEKARKILEVASNIWPENNEILMLKGETSFNLKDPKNIFTAMAKINLNDIDYKRKDVVELWTN